MANGIMKRWGGISPVYNQRVLPGTWAIVENDEEQFVAYVETDPTITDLHRGKNNGLMLDTYYTSGAAVDGKAIALLKNADHSYTTNPAYPGTATATETYIPVAPQDGKGESGCRDAQLL